MRRKMWLIILLVPFISNTQGEYFNELTAKWFIKAINEQDLRLENQHALASWAYDTNITDYNLQKKIQTGAIVAKREKQIWEIISKFNWREYKDESLKRQFYFYSILGSALLPEEKLRRFETVKSRMKTLYSTAKICLGDGDCGYALDPDLVRRFANSRNPDLLQKMWINWREAIGPKVKELYKEYVDLSNEVARLNNFTNMAEYWLEDFEDSNFRDEIRQLWLQLRPLYLQIHAYVRFHLRKKYGNIVSERGPIPAHLLGNMWAQSWGTLSDFTVPYPKEKTPNLSKELVKQGYNPKRIFQKAEEFFKSINFSAMPETFWKYSILEKPNDRNIVCHPSAWDFYKDDDVRIKQCTEVTLGHFLTAHHEMGHIHYYLWYKNQPVKFRRGANSGFHEAIGDTIKLSVRSSKHLRKIGLLKAQENERTLLNNLLSIGLDKIVFLPFGYIMDLWRWDVFSGKIKSENYNCEWWKLREEYQGVEPPVDRSEDDFDPPSKYHIVANVPYIRYFVSFVIQFQFHRSLCTLAGEYEPNNPDKPLHNCDIYGNSYAGNAFGNMLALGRSLPWRDTLEKLTLQRNMDASALVEYFRPLQIWVEKENKKNGAYIGWEKSTKRCLPTSRRSG